jgi:hypothetical protein
MAGNVPFMRQGPIIILFDSSAESSASMSPDFVIEPEKHSVVDGEFRGLPNEIDRVRCLQDAVRLILFGILSPSPGGMMEAGLGAQTLKSPWQRDVRAAPKKLMARRQIEIRSPLHPGPLR